MPLSSYPHSPSSPLYFSFVINLLLCFCLHCCCYCLTISTCRARFCFIIMRTYKRFAICLPRTRCRSLSMSLTLTLPLALSLCRVVSTFCENCLFAYYYHILWQREWKRANSSHCQRCFSRSLPLSIPHSPLYVAACLKYL